MTNPIIIPVKGKLATQTNEGEIFGDIFGTKNMSFDQMGYIKLAKKTSVLVSSAITSNFGTVNSISSLDGNIYYIMTSGHIFSVTLDIAAPTDMNGSGHVGGTKFDGLTWYQRWYISQDTDTANYEPIGLWNASGMTLTSGNYHPMCVHEGLNQLAIGDGNLVKLYSSTNATTHTLVTTITLSNNFEVRWIRYNNNALYIGTRNIKGGEAVVFTASGLLTSPDQQITVKGCNWVFSGVIHKGVLHIMTSQGQLMKLNGLGFDEVTHLPVFDTPYVWYDSNGAVNGKCDARGMISDGELIYLNIDGYINAPGNIQLPNQPSGIWIYDENIGLYHKAAASTDVTVSYAFSGISGNIITISSYTAQTGTKVFLSATNAVGISAPNFYYLIRLSATTFSLATSYNNAIAGTAITITSGSTGTILIRDDVNFGQTFQSDYATGAISFINDLNNTVVTYKSYYASQLLFGAGGLDSNTNTQSFSLQTFVVGYNRGYFVTTKKVSTSIKDVWRKIFVKYGYLFEGNDSIVVKYRIVDKEYYPYYSNTISTWLTSSSFSTATNYGLFSVGDEVEIAAGRGAGCTAHITAIQSADAGSYIVNLAESIPEVTVGDISTITSIQNWTTLTALNSSNGDEYNEYSIEKNSKWIQFKIILKGVSEPFIEELQIINSPQLLSE